MTWGGFARDPLGGDARKVAALTRGMPWGPFGPNESDPWGCGCAKPQHSLGRHALGAITIPLNAQTLTDLTSIVSSVAQTASSLKSSTDSAAPRRKKAAAPVAPPPPPQVVEVTPAWVGPVVGVGVVVILGGIAAALMAKKKKP